MLSDDRALARRTNGTSPSLYGLSLGNANAGSNWLAWMSRMGMNYGRLFVATNVNLRSTLGANFGAPRTLLQPSLHAFGLQLLCLHMPTFRSPFLEAPVVGLRQLQTPGQSGHVDYLQGLAQGFGPKLPVKQFRLSMAARPVMAANVSPALQCGSCVHDSSV